MNKNKTVQPLSENTRKAIIIAAIVVVAVIILSVALALILKPTALTPDDESSSSSGSSSLSIRNGDFEYVSSNDTAYPKTAQNWTRYGYKKASGSSHDFNSISDSNKALMGIVNVSNDDKDENNWNTVVNDLKAEGITSIKNPGLHKGIEDGNDDNSNIYMIATKGEPTVASILSDSASVSSGASVKITIWLNTAQLAEGSKAVVMIQKSTVSAKQTNWYAYDFEIDSTSEYEKDESGWQKLEFYIFNREASTKYIRVSIGIGNVYSGEEGLELENADEPITGEGILFVDDITYETVTANDYRKVVDAEGAKDSTMFKIIENEDITDESKYLELVTDSKTVVDNEVTFKDTYVTSEAYASTANDSSPFTDRDDFLDEDGVNTGFTIYKLSHNGSPISGNLAFRLTADELKDVKSSLILKDHHHLSFWIRVEQKNKAAYASVYVQKQVDGEWEDLNNASWTLVTTSQDIEEDANCGWVKYDIYLKPSANPETLSVLFVFGNKDGYNQEEQDLGLVPNGSMYVTSPAYENIAYNDYNSASSGSYVKKLDLVGTSASTTVTNGSFSTLDSSGRQPSNWTGAFGGDNSIFKDGQGNLSDLDRLASSIEGSGTIQGFEAPVKHASKDIVLDDEQKNVLQIKNNVATSYGYYSSNISLSAKTAYVISVMYKTENEALKPFIYLLNMDTTITDRAERIITSVNGAQSLNDDTARLLGYAYNSFGNGWTRYYMVIVTGNESVTASLALFNGSIDGTVTQTGTIYYDMVEMRTLATYSMVEADDDEKAENPDYETNYKVVWTDNRFYSSSSKANIEKYGENFGEFLEKESTTEGKSWLEAWGIDYVQPDADEWEAMKLIPEKEEPDDNNNDTTTEKTPSDVDLGLLFSVISSIALVAALLVVFVIKLYKNRNKKIKAA
ncbi:MAG: hypothetical protein J1G02_05575 [Clostridiales bacterium]|nr:hypothetical protein [Clostridiales bacterium]